MSRSTLSRMCLAATVAAAVCGVASAELIPFASANARVIDGTPDDWSGTPPAVDNQWVESANEWIWRDAAGDDDGDGGDAPGADDATAAYSYPTDAAYSGADADLLELRVCWDKANVYFLATMGDFHTWWAPAVGVCWDCRPGGQTSWGGFADCESSPQASWRYYIFAHGNGVGIWDTNWHYTLLSSVTVNEAGNTIEWSIPRATLGNFSGGPLAIIAHSGLEDGGNWRKVDAVASQWAGGGGLDDNDPYYSDPNIFDLAAASYADQVADLSGYTNTEKTHVSRSLQTITFRSAASVSQWHLYR